ncbi:MAG: glycosyltransferase family 39 protein [Planctomycetota bacterium]
MVFLVSFVLLCLLLQEHAYGDGIFYLWRARQREWYAHHHLYMPGMICFSALLELFSMPDRLACFLFHPFMTSAGNALLYLALRRCLEITGALALTLLVATTPSLLFFATTVENHAPHYAWVCLALWLCWRAIDQDTRLAWLWGGLGLAAVPASHLCGFLLVPALVWLAAVRGGSVPVISSCERPRLASLGLLVLPLLLYATLMHFGPVAVWFKGAVLGVPAPYLADPIGFQIRGQVLGREQSLGAWLPLLRDAWLLPAFGVWVALVLALPLLRRRRLLLLCCCGLVCFVIPVTLHGAAERGAYYLALLPLVATLLGRSGFPAGPLGVAAILALSLAQTAVGVGEIAAYPSSQKDPPWTWAADAAELGRKESLEFGGNTKAVFLCDDLWRVRHLQYEQRADAIHVPTELIQRNYTRLDRFLVYLETELLPHYLRRRPVIISDAMWEELPAKWPELRMVLATRFRSVAVAGGRFMGYRILLQ